MSRPAFATLLTSMTPSGTCPRAGRRWVVALATLTLWPGVEVHGQARIEPRQPVRDAQMIIGTVWYSVGRSTAWRARGAYVVATDPSRTMIFDGGRTDSEGTYTLNVPIGRPFEVVACLQTAAGPGLGFRRVRRGVARSVRPPRYNLSALVGSRSGQGVGDPDAGAQASPLELLEVFTEVAELATDHFLREPAGPRAFRECASAAARGADGPAAVPGVAFAVTTEPEGHTAQLDAVCRARFGTGWRTSDWRDIRAALRSGTDIEEIIPTSVANAWITYNGETHRSGTRRYFASRTPVHSGYLIHDGLDDVGGAGSAPVLVLGSWSGRYRVSCTRR